MRNLNKLAVRQPKISPCGRDDRKRAGYTILKNALSNQGLTGRPYTNGKLKIRHMLAAYQLERLVWLVLQSIANIDFTADHIPG